MNVLNYKDTQHTILYNVVRNFKDKGLVSLCYVSAIHGSGIFCFNVKHFDTATYVDFGSKVASIKLQCKKECFAYDLSLTSNILGVIVEPISTNHSGGKWCWTSPKSKSLYSFCSNGRPLRVSWTFHIAVQNCYNYYFLCSVVSSFFLPFSLLSNFRFLRLDIKKRSQLCSPLYMDEHVLQCGCYYFF